MGIMRVTTTITNADKEFVLKVITRVLIAVGCFFAAIACYVFGVPAGGAVFLILGIISEGLFWIGIFGRRKDSQAPR